MKRTFDAIVVGAGPAGSSAALLWQRPASLLRCWNAAIILVRRTCLAVSSIA